MHRTEWSSPSSRPARAVGRSPTLSAVTAEAHHHYEDLHDLVDRLGPDQADVLRAVALQLVRIDPAPAAGDEPPGEWPPPWFGSITSDEADTAERSRDILRAEFGRS